MQSSVAATEHTPRTSSEIDGDHTSAAAWERAALSVIRLLPGSRSLKFSQKFRTVARGTVWTLLGYASSQLLRLGSTLILARALLSPQAFGLVALVNVFLTGLDMLSDLGIGVDVIQNARGDDPAFINTAFLIQAARGLVLWIIAMALAFPFAYFYHQPEVRWFAIVGAFSVAVRGVASGSIWLMTRHLEIRKLTLLNTGSEAVGFIVSVTWAFLSPTAWALIVGRLSTAIAYTLGSHLVSKYRVSFMWSREAARDILLFGAGIALSTATYFLGGEAERLVIGKFISVAELGCFSLALTLSAAPARAIQQVVGQIFFPLIAFSLRDNPEKAERHFRSARYAFLLLGSVLGCGFIGYGHRLVALLLSPKYAMIGWMLQLMGFRAGQEVFAAPCSSLILACGDSRYAAIFNSTRLVLMVAGIWLAFRNFGIHEAIAVLAFVPALAYPILMFGVHRHLRKAFWIELSSYLSFCGVMAVAAFLPWPWARA